MTYKRRTFDADFKVLDSGVQSTTTTTDTINEKTSAAGVTIDGVLLKDNAVNTDTINEKTSAAGVTIDGVLLKDGVVKDGTGTQLSTLQDIQNAAADKASYYFYHDTTQTSKVEVPSNSKLNVGLSDLTIISTVSVTSTTGFNTIAGIQANTPGFIIYIDDTGAGVGGGTFQEKLFDRPLSNQVFTLAAKRYSGNKYKGFLNGIASSEITAAAFEDINGPAFFRTGWPGAIGWQGRAFRSILFNYALSADKIARYSAGAKLDWEDVGGSMTDKTSGLSWVNVSFTTPTISGKQISGLVGNIYARADIVGVGPITAGKIYRVYYTGMTSTPANMLSLSLLTNAQGEASAYMPVTAASGYVDIVCTVTDANCRLMIQARYGAVSAGGITITSMVQLGAVLDLEPENITDNTWFDASPNGLHGTVTGALAQRFTPSYDTRNYIINGAMEFDQRRAFVQSVDLTSDVSFVSDRFKVESFGAAAGVYRIQTVNEAPTGLSHSAEVSSSSGYYPSASIFFDHIIEGNTLKTLGLGTTTAKTFTVSFWVKASAVGLMSVAFRNSALTASYVTTVNINTAGVWEYKSISIPKCTIGAWLTDNNIGCYFTIGIAHRVSLGIAGALNAWSANNWSFASGQTNFLAFALSYVQITGVMLNEGPVAAPFQRAGGSIGGELALCQRYYEKSYNLSKPPGSAAVATGIKLISSGTNLIIPVAFKVRKRTSNPTITIYSASTGAADNIRNESGATDVAASINSKNEWGFCAHATSIDQSQYSLCYTSEDEI